MKRVLFNFYRALMLEQYIQRIITQQEINGWQFNSDKANEYLIQLRKLKDELYTFIRPHLSYSIIIPYQGREISKPFKKDGTLSNNVCNWMGDSSHIISGPFTRVIFEEPNLDSDKQLKEQLFKLGWEPDAWNYKKDKSGKKIYINGEPIKTSPKLTESSYDSLTVGIGPSLAKYLKVSMRISSIEGWLSRVREDGTISAMANPLGTPTARFRHSSVVNVPKANKEVFFGKECRSLFTHRPGRTLVGHDASGLEARMEANNVFTINKEYAMELIHGDIHTKNKDKWSKITKKEIPRPFAKNGKYALTYGAYPPKIRDTLKVSLKAAQKIFDEFWGADNPLGILKRRLTRFWKKNGCIMGLDGRPIFIRKESALVNSKFQSDGALTMKASTVILFGWVRKYRLDVIKVGDFHDEGQADVALHHAEIYGRLACQSIRRAGELFNMYIPLDAEYSIGENWSETH